MRPALRQILLGGGEYGTTGWATFSGSGSVVNGGTLTVTSGAQTVYTVRKEWPALLNKGAALKIRLKRDANLSVLDIRIECDINGTPKTFLADLGVSSVPVGRVYDLILPLASFTAPSGGSFINERILGRVRIGVTPVAGYDTKFTVYDMRWVGDDGVPKVCFTFDDGWDTTYSTAYPILSANGYTGSIPLEYNNIGTANHMSQANLDTLYGAGWSVMGHYSSQLTSMSDADALVILQASHDYLVVSHSYTRGASHWVWPGGARDEDKDALAATLFKTRRGTNPMTRYATQAYYDPYDVSHAYMLSTTTLAAVEGFIDLIADTGGKLIFTFHSIVSTITRPEDWLDTDFRSLVEYCAAKGLADTNYDNLFGSYY